MNGATFVSLNSELGIPLDTPVSDLSRNVVSHGLAGFNPQGFRPNMKKSFFLPAGLGRKLVQYSRNQRPKSLPQSKMFRSTIEFKTAKDSNSRYKKVELDSSDEQCVTLLK